MFDCAHQTYEGSRVDFFFVCVYICIYYIFNILIKYILNTYIIITLLNYQNIVLLLNYINSIILLNILYVIFLPFYFVLDCSQLTIL